MESRVGGSRGPSRVPISHDGGFVQMVKNMGGGGGDAVKEICLGGCIRPDVVCGGYDVLRADLTG